MLEKMKVIKKIEITETGHLQIQYAMRIMEDGKLYAETYERRVVHIDDDLSTEEDKIKAFADFKVKNLYPKKPILNNP